VTHRMFGWLLVSVGCGGGLVQVPQTPREATVLRPRIGGSGTVEIRTGSVPDRVLVVSADGSGVTSVPSIAVLADWAGATSDIDVAHSCEADLGELGMLEAICVVLGEGRGLDVDLTAVPSDAYRGGAWSELDRLESSCEPTQDPATIRCTLSAEGQRVAPLVTFEVPETGPEPPGFACESEPRVVGTIRGLREWGDRLVVVGEIDHALGYPGPIQIGADGGIAGCLPEPSRDGAPPTVLDVVRHPDGGYLVSGEFTELGGTRCPGLAHVRADGSVDAQFCDAMQGRLEPGRIVVRDRRVYVAGRSRVWAVDLDSLLVVDRSASSTAPRREHFADVILDGDTLYVASAKPFWIGDLYRPGLAAFAVDSLSVGAFAPQFDGEVNALHVQDDRLWVGGGFQWVDDEERSGLAIFDLSSGKLQPSAVPLGTVHDLEPDPAGVWVAGDLHLLPSPAGLALLDEGGTVLPDTIALDHAPSRPTVHQVVEQDGIVTVAGTFDQAGGEVRDGLAAFRRSDGALVPLVRLVGPSVPSLYDAGDGELWIDAGSGELVSGSDVIVLDPDTSSVQSVPVDLGFVAVGLRIDEDVAFVWGHTSVDKEDVRGHLAVVDLTTGARLRSDVTVDSSIEDVVVTPDRIFIGGEPRGVGGDDPIVAIDRVDGEVIESFRPQIERWPGQMALHADDLVLTGETFPDAVIWLDAETGDRRDTPSPPLDTLYRAELDAGQIFGRGWTPASVSGLPRDGHLFAVDASTGSLLNWQPDVAPYGDVVVLDDAVAIVEQVAGASQLVTVDRTSGALVRGEVALPGLVRVMRRFGDRVAIVTTDDQLLVVDPFGP